MYKKYQKQFIILMILKINEKHITKPFFLTQITKKNSPHINIFKIIKKPNLNSLISTRVQ